MFAILNWWSLSITMCKQYWFEKGLSFCYVSYVKEVYFRMLIRNVASMYKMASYYSQ